MLNNIGYLQKKYTVLLIGYREIISLQTFHPTVFPYSGNRISGKPRRGLSCLSRAGRVTMA